jgi:hypothetical protein
MMEREALAMDTMDIGGTIPAEALKPTVADISVAIDANVSMKRTMSEWRLTLSKECQVYVIDEQYIAKRFDEVHYRYCGIDEAKEILKDNLWAVLLFKYFPVTSDDALARISEIVTSMTENIKTFLTRITLDHAGGNPMLTGMQMKTVPDSAAAFANGIYDFKENRFILRYKRIYIPQISNKIILYQDYIITWCFDFDFDPLGIDIMKTPLTDFVSMMRDFDKEQRNFCFELFWNMTHDMDDRSDPKRMQHFTEVLGYVMVPRFLQYFIMLIGAGQNGKNSLFDGCFSSHVVPKPASNSLDTIEQDRFITGTLENTSHNFFLETSPKTYTDSNMLKALTGSMYQSIEEKGETRFSGVINCKYVFAGNDQSKIKFSDTTPGFRRRINVFEIFYSWDPEHRYMTRGDYYPTDFSGDLHEIKNDISNTVVFIYLAMYGVKSATGGFSHDFRFNYNEWTDAYSDVDLDMKDFFDSVVKAEDYFAYADDVKYCDKEHLKSAFYTADGNERPYLTEELKKEGVFDYDKFSEWLMMSKPTAGADEDGNDVMIDVPNWQQYMTDHDLFISLIYLKALMARFSSMGLKPQRDFNDMFRKIYTYAYYTSEAHRESYVKCRLMNGKIRFVGK